jgi:propanediol dehydratase large subunit
MTYEYDMIDRFLRNNLGDDNYAEYSAALDSLAAAPQAKPLTDDQIMKIASSIHKFTPMQIARLQFARYIEEAHGIKE